MQFDFTIEMVKKRTIELPYVQKLYTFIKVIKKTQFFQHHVLIGILAQVFEIMESK